MNHPLFQSLLRGHVPFEGRVPRYLSDRTDAVWNEERSEYKEERIPCSSDAVASYYAVKGVSYIQVEGKGLYHTGVDTLHVGVPVFNSKTAVRIRVKKHKSAPLSLSVQASIVFDTTSLVPSVCNLDHSIPDVFRQNNNLG
jgi:hypothetical protein